MFSLVVPIFRNEDTIPDLLKVLAYLAERMHGDFEAVLVVDGSPDRSYELLLSQLPHAPFRSQLVALSRNFGSFAAIRAGMAAARGDFLAVMSADLQEPPELMLAFRERLMTGEVDVVVGTRAQRGDRLASSVAARLFWWLYRRFVQPEVPPGGVDVFACTRQFRDRLLALSERNTTLIGLIFWLGYRRAEIPYIRLPRRSGRSAWTLRRRVRYLLDSVFAFSDLPLKILTVVGLSGVAVSLGLGLFVLYARVTGGISVPGYAATVLTIIFFGGLNSLGIGLLGEYLWRTFENTKGRPGYLVARHLVFDHVAGGKG